jgi:hypothetical protein
MKKTPHLSSAQGRPERTRVRYPLFHPSYILLVIPFIAMLWVSSYARQAPALWGVPFFYWYQFAWLIVTAILTQAVFVLVRGGW